MSLDEFQKRVSRIISINRTEKAPFTAGSVITGDVLGMFDADRNLLVRNGMGVELVRSVSGFAAAIVSDMDGERRRQTRIQWVQAGLKNFFTPIADPELGFRLHFADRSVNKVFAGAGRRQVRDFVDLWMIDRLSIPLWRLALAAPGKDSRWSPVSLIERLSANMVFSKEDFVSDVFSMIELEPSKILLDLTDAVDEARDILPRIDQECFGKIAVVKGRVEMAREMVKVDEWVSPAARGARSSSAFPEGNLIEKIIMEYGENGANISDSLTFPES